MINTKKTYRENKKSIFAEYVRDEITLGVLAFMINVLPATVQELNWTVAVAST